MVAPCAVVSQEMIDLLCDTPDKHQLLHVGGGFTVIYGPDGARIGDKLAPDAEGIIYADIDLGMISVAKAAADPAGHYARPDVTRLLFNNPPAPRVEMLVLPVDQITETAPRVEPTTAPAGGSTENLAPTARPAAAE